jgi:hypothetical protein
MLAVVVYVAEWANGAVVGARGGIIIIKAWCRVQANRLKRGETNGNRGWRCWASLQRGPTRIVLLLLLHRCEDKLLRRGRRLQ